jgi:palmitoyl-protein thioesterase
MAEITQLSGKRVGAYAACVGGADSQEMDTVNGFFENMTYLVDYFAAQVRKNAHLKGGFDAVGLSQGNLIIRGYVEMYNDPPVRRFISIHGPLAGTGSLPQCDPDSFAAPLCRKATELVGEAAYLPAVQRHIAQSNYLKDPEMLVKYKRYNAFLPILNNEVTHARASEFKARFASLDRLVLVKAEGDTMIFPKDSEWFGFFKDGSFDTVLAMNETSAYREDAFGLKTLDRQGKIKFATTKGNHLRFSLEELYALLDAHLKDPQEPALALLGGQDMDALRQELVLV